MKAAVLYQPGNPLQLRTGIEVPTPSRGQVLVRLAFSGVCHSQLMEVRGCRGKDPHLPHLLGHEGSGIVVRVGAEVTKVKADDRVVVGWIRGSGLDAPSTRYHLGNEVLNAGAVTTFNELALVSENRCVPLPDGIPMDVAVLLGCAIPTGVGIVANTVQPKTGSTIAIFGLGGVGLSALIACRLKQPAQLIAVDISKEKLAIAADFGATATINAGSTDPVEEIRRLTGGSGVDYAIESAGKARTVEQAFESVRRGGGTCVFASHPPTGDRINLDPHELISGKRIVGSWGGASNPDVDVPRFATLYRKGMLPLEKLVTRGYMLDDINRALDDLEQRRAIRPLIEIDRSIS